MIDFKREIAVGNIRRYWRRSKCHTIKMKCRSQGEAQGLCLRQFDRKTVHGDERMPFGIDLNEEIVADDRD